MLSEHLLLSVTSYICSLYQTHSHMTTHHPFALRKILCMRCTDHLLQQHSCTQIYDKPSGLKMGRILFACGRCGLSDSWVLTGKKNYSTEAAHLICNVLADYPKHIAYIVIHNRTVNTDSKPGNGKPIDQLLEHYNL